MSGELGLEGGLEGGLETSTAACTLGDLGAKVWPPSPPTPFGMAGASPSFSTSLSASECEVLSCCSGSPLAGLVPGSEGLTDRGSGMLSGSQPAMACSHSDGASLSIL